MDAIWMKFIEGMKQTTALEFIAVFSGIASVYLTRIENVLAYPVGLVNTIIYIFLSLKVSLLGEASVNLYYTIMSIIGWLAWIKKDEQKKIVLHVSYSNKTLLRDQFLFFGFFYLAIFFTLTYLKSGFAKEAIPWADAFASATAFTGMWLMTKKKVESWFWWIATDIASVPLYFVKDFVFTSVYYVVLTVMAVAGLIAWMKSAKKNKQLLQTDPVLK